MFPWLTVLIAWPLVAALATYIAGKAAPGGNLARNVGLTTALVELALVISAFFDFDLGAAGTHQLVETHNWIPAIGVSYAVGADGVAMLLIGLSALLVPLVILAAFREFADAATLGRYIAIVLVLESFMVAVFAARDVFFFYVLFEAMLIPVYFLIGAFGQGAQRRYAAVKFLLFSLAGGLVMLVAVIALYLQVPVADRGPQTFLTENLAALGVDGVAGRLMFLAFFLAFAVKAPMVPVHAWLPDVADNATPGTSTLLISVLDKVGTFGMLTLCIPLFPEAAAWAAPVIVILAVISILYGAILAIGQSDILRLIGYTSVSHFGFIILGIFTFTSTGTAGASFMMLNHGISTGALFLVAGFAIARHPSKSQKIADYGGMRAKAPILGGTFLIAGLSAAALPGLSSFVSEILVFLGTFSAVKWAAIVSVPAVVLAAIYVVWMYQRMFTGAVRDELADTRDLDGRERTVVGVLIALLLVLGFVPQLGLQYVNDPAQVTIQQVGTVDPAPLQSSAAGVHETATQKGVVR
jgi:NADH-quinone oxidoreductase subunit M